MVNVDATTKQHGYIWRACSAIERPIEVCYISLIGLIGNQQSGIGHGIGGGAGRERKQIGIKTWDMTWEWELGIGDRGELPWELRAHSNHHGDQR